MKAKDIVVGGRYFAKVGGNVVTVRVDDIEKAGDRLGVHGVKRRTRYHVTNLRTRRELTFCSAARFRGRDSGLPEGVVEKVCACGATFRTFATAQRVVCSACSKAKREAEDEAAERFGIATNKWDLLDDPITSLS